VAAIPLSSRLDELRNVLVNHVPMEVERTWMHGEHVIFKFKGVDTISDAEKLAGADVAIPLEERGAAPEGEYFQSDLVGCEVFATDGRRIGTVKDWEQTGGVPLLVVSRLEKHDLMVPFARSICTRIAPEARRIEVNLPEGLEDLN